MCFLIRCVVWLTSAIAALALSGCSTVPTHPTLRAADHAGKLPTLVPMRRFVANIDFLAGHVISPDGRQLMWLQTVGTDIGLAVRAVDTPPGVEGEGTRRFATGTLARPGASGATYAWLPDSRHVAYQKDFQGNENTQFFVVDTQNPGAKPWAVTPWPGVRSVFVARSEPGSARFYFASNRRDRSRMDLFEADATNRTVREVARNETDGRVLGWLIGVDHQLAGRWRQLGSDDGSGVAAELLNPDGTWRLIREVDRFDFFAMHRVDLSAGRLWAVSNMGRDKSALLEIDLGTGGERVLAEHPDVDLDSAWYLPGREGPYAYLAEPALPSMSYLDAALGAEIEQAIGVARARGWLHAQPVVTKAISTSEDAGRMVLHAITEDETVELLLDRRSAKVQRLSPPRKPAEGLFTAAHPFAFKTSDGLTLHGYITRPAGVQGAVPLVVNIHGGPWVRDRWEPATFNINQMLANRGYAVLRVNYRGSAGYGKAHLRAGALEYNGRIQRDIAEAVQWAIDEGIADPDRMAVLGGSFGGFSVLAQLIQKPHAYRCGVNIVGVANWPRVIENWPPFWRNRHYFEMTYGDVNNPEARARMLASSPISKIDRITEPLLVIHGDNDIRVLRQDSDDVVAALRALGRPVTHLRFADEGHQVRKWRNRLTMWREIEDKLATCLGGRSAGFDLYELVPR